jgi:hypothetical protein
LQLVAPGREMNFQRITLGLFVLLVAALGVAFYIDWRMAVQLRTVKAFVESYVFAEAVAACENAKSSTPFKWNDAKQTAVIGLNSVKLNKDTVIASYTLVADSVYCDYDPIKKKANIGSNFLERD